ncbi:MAG TPA: class I SAM-dependent methyltransferase [Promineifilum sp.]|nr:class I SAM-dependent methyltransferase [Promineifilum sp.]
MSERQRVHEIYARRQGHSERYSLGNPAHLFIMQGRQRAVLRRLRREGLWPLAGHDILEVGCGSGGVLLELLTYGADAGRLHGTDLLGERVAVARRRLPHVAVTCADGRSLPYPDQSFDLVLQFTMFSSILDQGLCYTVANEMRRVLRPGGLLLWYDFWLNPTNRQTRGIRPREIRQYFPDSQYVFERITLAPPLTNHLVPFSWVAALSLERLGIFNTHYLAAIRPNR